MSALILWRHAPTAYNAQRRLQGRIDVPLGEPGLDAAAWAAQRIADTHGTNLRVVSSPLARAQATAAVLANLIGVPVETDVALTQRSYGEWEGLTMDEVAERWPEEHARRRRGLDPRIAGWEAQDEVAQRVGTALRALWDPERPTVAVSHGSTIALGLLSLIGEPPSSRVLGRVPHTAWSVVLRADSGAWHIESFALGAD